jgi:HAD superfamily hydrolase (TIGR01490 family)
MFSSRPNTSLVFFDFDQTLTSIDTTLPFASFLACALKKRKNYYLFLAVYLVTRLRLVSNNGFKESFVRLFLYHEPVKKLSDLARKFLKRYLALVENQEIVDLLRKYAANGNEVYLVSANFDFFLSALMDKWPVTDILATCVEVNDNFFTGKLAGKACHGNEKLRRVVSFFGEDKVKDAIAYGDSKADIGFLEYTRKGYLVQSIKVESRASIFSRKIILYITGFKYLSIKNMFQCKNKIIPIVKKY